MTIAGIALRALGAVKIGRLYLSHRKALTALASGGQTGATLLDRVMNNVTVVANGNDSVRLPPCEQSRVVIVVNNAASNAMQVFSFESTGVTINGTAGSTGVSQAAGKVAIYISVGAGTWNRLLSA